MTAADFFLLSIAFGGFVIVALVLWSIARVADRKQESKRGRDIHPDVDSRGNSSGDGRKKVVRPGRANNMLRRLAGWASIESPERRLSTLALQRAAS